jgi:hypothetical protein
MDQLRWEASKVKAKRKYSLEKRKPKGYTPSPDADDVEEMTLAPVRVYVHNGQRAGYLIKPQNAAEPEVPYGTIYAAPQYMRRGTLREW